MLRLREYEKKQAKYKKNRTIRKTLEKRDWHTVKDLWRRYQREYGLVLIARHPGTFYTVGGYKNHEPQAVVEEVTDQHKQFDMGFFTGMDSRCIVVDVDDPEKFDDFLKNRELELPPTLTHRTRGNKRHYLYRIPENAFVPGCTNQEYGFDIIGELQTAPLPMSIHRKEPELLIEVENSLPIAECPKWLMRYAKEVDEKRARHSSADNDVAVEDLPYVRQEVLPADLRVRINQENATYDTDRSREAFACACAMLRLGKSFEETVSVIWNNPVGDRYHERDRGYEQLLYMVNKVYAEKPEEQIQWNTVRIPRAEELDDQYRVLAEHATLDLKDILEKHNNIVTPERLEDLENLMLTYSALANGKMNERVAFPLPTGYGKSTSIVAFLSRAAKIGMFKGDKSDFTIAITAFKVSELCSLYSALVNEGVPEELICLHHSYLYDPKHVKEGKVTKQGYAPLPATGNIHRPILLLTHNKVKTKDQSFRELVERRSLLIWDESMISTEVGTVSVGRVSAGVSMLETKARTLSVTLRQNGEEGKAFTIEESARYLKACLEEVVSQITSQLQGHPKKVLNFDHGLRIREGEVIECVDELSKDARRSKDSIQDEVLNSLIAFTRITMHEAVVELDSTNSDHFIMRFDVVMPDSVENIVILDASTWINKLMQLDETISIPEGMSPSLSYAGTKFHRLDLGGGWNTISKEVQENKRGLLDAINEIAKEYPGEKILVFTHKERDGVESRSLIETFLESKGHDLTRFKWLTHGNYTASNEYADCTVMIFVGILYKPEYIYSAQAIAQTRDIATSVSATDINLVKRTSHAADLHQGTNRGASRVITGNTARPVNVYYTYHDDSLLPYLEQVMPDLEHVVCTKLKPKTKLEAAVQAVCRLLDLTADTYISKAAITKRVSELADISKGHRPRVWKAVLEALEGQWKQVGQSLVKV